LREKSTCRQLGELNDMNKIIHIIANIAVSLLDRAFSFSLSIRYYNENRMYNDTVRSGLRILDKIGEHFLSIEYKNELEITKNLIVGKLKQKNIDEMKIMSAEVPLVTITILFELCLCCYFNERKLLPFVVLRMVQLTLKHGISKYSSFGFVMFGFILSSKHYTNRLGYECGDFALLLLKKIPAKEVKKEKVIKLLLESEVIKGFLACLKFYYFILI